MDIFKRTAGAAVALMLIVGGETCWAANAYPLFTNFKAGAADVGDATAGAFGAYGVNVNASLNGNQVLSISQPPIDPLGQVPANQCCHGVTMAVNVSNGENGITATEGLPDVNNPAPVNPVFTTIGNASNKLENGNVFRLSAWFRSDPANPITFEPQVAPVLKFEIWKEMIGNSQDTNGTKVRPDFGDRLFDQDQQGLALSIADTPNYVDINNDGAVSHDPTATTGNGKLFGIATDHWTLASVTYTINKDDWLGIGPTFFGAGDINVVESVQAIIFLGNFGGPVQGPGNLLVDNALVEVFKNQAAVTPLANPNPTLSEGLLGDYNGDHVVNAADYTVWQDTLGSTTDLRANGDNSGASAGKIDAADLIVWKTKFGTSQGSGGVGPGGAAPEPSSLCLVSLAVVSLGVYFRRRS